MDVFAVHFEIRIFAMFVFHNVRQLVMLELILFGVLFSNNFKYIFAFIIPVG